MTRGWEGEPTQEPSDLLEQGLAMACHTTTSSAARGEGEEKREETREREADERKRKAKRLQREETRDEQTMERTTAAQRGLIVGARQADCGPREVPAVRRAKPRRLGGVPIVPCRSRRADG